jgi:hypothetical protein
MGTKGTRKQLEREEAIARLREWIKPGDTVYTILRHRARSGMMRTIDVYLFLPDLRKGHKPRSIVKLWLSYNVARATGYTFSKAHESIVVGGCGFDAGFQLVYELSRLLFPDAKDPGYVLHHEWIG